VSKSLITTAGPRFSVTLGEAARRGGGRRARGGEDGKRSQHARGGREPRGEFLYGGAIIEP